MKCSTEAQAVIDEVISLSCHFPTRNDTGVFVSDIVKEGLVDADGRLMQGDQILSVNGEDVRSATQEAVAALLKVHEPHRLIESSTGSELRMCLNVK